MTGGQLRQSRVSGINLYAPRATKDERKCTFSDLKDDECDHFSGTEGERNETRWHSETQRVFLVTLKTRFHPVVVGGLGKVFKQIIIVF